MDPSSRQVFVNGGPNLAQTGTGGGQGTAFATYQDLRQASLETPASGGSPVTVSSPQVVLTFSNVNQPGTTTITAISTAELPAGIPNAFNIGGALLYEVTTTATVGGNIALCFNAANVDNPASFDSLHVLHFENGAWVDRTTSKDFESVGFARARHP